MERNAPTAEQNTQKNRLDLCSILRSFLQGTELRLQGMDLATILILARHNGIEAMLHAALEKAGALEALGPDLMAQLAQERAQAAYCHVLYVHERTQVCKRLEAAGIWYMPLKGSVLAELYPGLGLRQMGDTDILFDPTRREDVKTIMTDLGYRPEYFEDATKHDVYTKDPFFTFEMHFLLFSFIESPLLLHHYEHIGDRLLRSDTMERRFRPEDLYVYLLAHGFKHVSGGHRLRFLLDIGIFRSKTPPMDEEYLQQELELLSLTSFEKTIVRLTEKLFVTGAPLTDEELRCFSYYTYADPAKYETRRAANRLYTMASGENIDAKTKLRYLLRRFWPEQEWFVRFYPFLARYPFLKPFFLIWRALRGLLSRPKRIRAELQALRHPEQSAPFAPDPDKA